MRATTLLASLVLGLAVAGSAAAQTGAPAKPKTGLSALFAHCKDAAGKPAPCPKTAAAGPSLAKTAPASVAAAGPPKPMVMTHPMAMGSAPAIAGKPPVQQPSGRKPLVQAANGKPTARCKDGSLYYNKTHSGACSRHGGVKAWL
ncbi:MAG: DUF3761 domain-containing protein [Caulobacteraceae bacterium]|nr:DUF3761 domain-containing protein [Caulobacteraceae bacterium]